MRDEIGGDLYTSVDPVATGQMGPSTDPVYTTLLRYTLLKYPLRQSNCDTIENCSHLVRSGVVLGNEAFTALRCTRNLPVPTVPSNSAFLVSAFLTEWTNLIRLKALMLLNIIRNVLPLCETLSACRTTRPV